MIIKVLEKYYNRRKVLSPVKRKVLFFNPWPQETWWSLCWESGGFFGLWALAQCLKMVSGNPLMLFSLWIMEYLRHECIDYNHNHVIILGLRDKLRGCCDVGKKEAGGGISKFSIFSVDFTFLGHYCSVWGLKVQKIALLPE